MRLEVAILQHQAGRGAAVVVDVAHEAACRLLDAYALAHLARTRLQHLDADAVFLFESLDDGLVERRAEGSRVDDKLAFFLPRLDYLLPVGVGLGCRRACDGKQRRERYEFPSEHRRRLPVVLSCFQSVLIRFLMKPSCTQRNSSTSASMSRPMTLTSSGLPPAHIFSISTDSTSVPGA